MSGDDRVHDAVNGPEAIGCWTRCPRCGKHGVVDDVRDGDVIIRHSADVWHVSSKLEANQILWPWRL